MELRNKKNIMKNKLMSKCNISKKMYWETSVIWRNNSRLLYGLEIFEALIFEHMC